MLPYTLRRLLQMLPPLVGLSILLFVLLRVGGDPVALLVRPEAPPEEIAAMRAAYGFDRPLLEQYLTQVQRIVVGDFGTSIRFRTAALPLVLERLPATLQLAGTALAIAILVALPIGILSALHRNSWFDFAVTVATTIGRGMPNFWLGIMLMLVFAVQLRWLPASGRDGPASVILPAVTIGVSIATVLVRVLRSAMIETLSQDYVRTARAKGLGPATVVLRHAFRNALISVVTVLGLQTAWIIGGSVVVEEVFAWPGSGRLMLTAVLGRDLSVVMAGVFVFALLVMAINLVVDLSYSLLDPRIQYA
jgi:peptide/nickel transport system permease protein